MAIRRQTVWHLQRCPRCRGDLVWEGPMEHEMEHEDVEWYCLQCGHVIYERMDIIARPSPNHGGLRQRTDGIIVHSTRGGARTPDLELQATLNWFSSPRSQTSAHYVVAHNGQVYECVSPDHIAWHAREHNATWLGIELVQARFDIPFTDAQYRSLAGLARMLSQQFGFPLSRRTLRGHDEMPAGQRDGKSDPGPLFDWERFLALLQDQRVEEQEMDRNKAREAMDALRRWYAIQAPAANEIVHLRDAHGSEGARRVADAAGHALRALHIIEEALGEPRTGG